MTYLIPRVGQVVLRFKDGTWSHDWVEQVRIGEEISVLVWGNAGRAYERFGQGQDTWKECLHLLTGECTSG